jgi:hypothetical protein
MCELDEVGTIQVWSKIQVHGEEGGHEMMIKCSTWKRREKQNLMEIKAKVLHRVLVLVIKTP